MEEAFVLEFNDLLIEDEVAITSICINETRGSSKEIEPSKCCSGKEEGSKAIDSDSDVS